MAESLEVGGAEETPQEYFRRTMAERHPKEWEIGDDGQTYSVGETEPSSRPLFEAFEETEALDLR